MSPEEIDRLSSGTWEALPDGKRRREVVVPNAAAAKAFDEAVFCIEHPSSRTVKERAESAVSSFLDAMDIVKLPGWPETQSPRDWLLAYERYQLWHKDAVHEDERSDEYLKPEKWEARQVKGSGKQKDGEA